MQYETIQLWDGPGVNQIFYIQPGLPQFSIPVLGENRISVSSVIDNENRFSLSPLTNLFVHLTYYRTNRKTDEGYTIFEMKRLH